MNIDGEPSRNVKTLNGETSLGDSTADDLIISGDLSVAGTSSLEGTLNMNNAKIINVGTPTSPADAASKQYVDGVIPDTSVFFKKDGSVAATGDFDLNSNKITGLANGTAATDAAAFGQIPAAPDLTPYFKKDGSVAATGDFDLNSHKLVNVTDPASAQDGATKAYVDSKASPWTVDGSNLEYTTGGIDVTGTSTFGESSIGNDTVSATTAVFSHKDWVTDAPALQQVKIGGSTIINTEGTTGAIYFQKDKTTNMMVIKGSNGYVGIGEEVPSYKLTVRGDGGNALRLEADDHVYMGFFPKGDASGGRYAWFGYANSNQATEGLLTLYLEKGANSSGSRSAGFKVVGQNGSTRAPLIVQGYKLSLDKRWWNFNVSAIGSVTTGSPSEGNPHNQSRISVEATHGYLTNTGYLQSSDDIIKSLEKPIEVGLKEILQLEPKHYLKHPTIRVPADDETGKTLPIDEEGRLFQMTEDGEKEPLECHFELGLISQAVEKIKGLEILVTEEINGIKNVNYVGLIPVLVKAIQELDKKRKADEKRILDLNKRLLVLEEKLKNVESNSQKEYIL
ncbi:hypothetical protein N9991_00705 [bacterium]|nr:hypothetical protein [bacterium]